MTKQEKLQKAINQISIYVNQDDDMYTGYRENNEALKIAIKCIEKQIPKKPKPIYLDYCDEPTIVSYNCIKCGLEVGVNYADGHKVREHHCCCGQAIDWSDNE